MNNKNLTKDNLSYLPRQQMLQTNGLQFCVEERGDPKGEPIVFIMGLACQMTHWPNSLLNEFAGLGYRVIRFDNRDIGLSQKVKSEYKINTRRAFLGYKLGITPRANYTLHNMAADTAKILKTMEIEDAHIVGASMGGMIAQLLAANHSHYVRSLTTIMSSTNHPKLPMPSLELMIKMGFGDKGVDRDSVIKRWTGFWTAVQSPDYPARISDVKEQIESNYLRNYSPGGTVRQIQAILATGSLEKYLKWIDAPTLVIHGDKDPLLKPACGRAIARGIKDAQLEIIKGMGHDLPEQLNPKFVELIHSHIEETKGRQERLQ